MSNLLHTEHFYNALFEENFLSDIYSEIKFENTVLEVPFRHVKKSKIYSFNLFPNYITPSFNEHTFCKKIVIKPGFAVKTEGFDSIEDYLKQCKASFRKVINRSVNRLESCFNISYKMFFGNIEKEDYRILMSALQQMLISRFEIKKGRNRVLENWDYYLNFAFESINNKNASLFVIYNGNEPIEISLNFHCNTIMYSSISSYHLDYSKFSLGNIEIYKQLEWCIENNMALFDMGYGNFDYKRRWSNFIYEFEWHVISNKNSKITSLYFYYLKNKTQLINYLISKNINDKFYDVVEKLKGKQKKADIILEYDFLELESLPQNIKTLEGNSEKEILRRPLFEYLYKFPEHIDHINIYALENESNALIVEGKQSITKIHVKK